MTREQAEYVKPVVNPAPLCHLLDTNPGDTIQYVNAFLKMQKSEESNKTYWFPTPQDSGDEAQHTPIQKRRLQEMRALQELEQLSPEDKQESFKHILSTFGWTDSTLDMKARKAIEDLLVELHNIFARHRVDICVNIEFKVKLMSLYENSAISQSPPNPINLKENITVEIALLFKYGVNATLPFSKNTSPIFAQREPNGKLRLLIYLRKIK